MADQPSVIEGLEAALRAAGLRQSVIAHNLANLNTPGYRRGEVRFEEQLAKVLASSRPGDLAKVAAEVVRPMTSPVGPNGNDVDLDMEIGELLKNSGRYKLYMRLMSKMYSQMELAIRSH